MSMIETRAITQEDINRIENFTAFEIEDNFRDGDFLYMSGLAFAMVHYSAEDFKGSSRYVTWWSELYNIEIQLDRKEDTVTVETPVIDYRKEGF